MLQIVKNEERPVELVGIDNTSFPIGGMYVAKRIRGRSRQDYILTETCVGGVYVWTCFYCKASKSMGRTTFNMPKQAIAYALEQGLEVFSLSSKEELGNYLVAN